MFCFKVWRENYLCFCSDIQTRNLGFRAEKKNKMKMKIKSPGNYSLSFQGK